MTEKLMISAAAIALIGVMGVVETPGVAAQEAREYDRAIPQVCLPRGVAQTREERVTVTGARIRNQPQAEALAAPPPPPPPPPPPMQVQRAATDSAGRVAHFAAPSPQPVPNRDRFEDVPANPVMVTTEDPVSTFSIDVDTASYAVVRNHLHDCELPPTDAVRIEEMVNYFDYEYALPDDAAAPFSTSVQVMPTPWNEDTQLLHIGVQGYDLVPTERPRANLVFLIAFINQIFMSMAMIAYFYKIFFI